MPVHTEVHGEVCDAQEKDRAGGPDPDPVDSPVFHKHQVESERDSYHPIGRGRDEGTSGLLLSSRDGCCGYTLNGIKDNENHEDKPAFPHLLEDILF